MADPNVGRLDIGETLFAAVSVQVYAVDLEPEKEVEVKEENSDDEENEDEEAKVVNEEVDNNFTMF